MSTIKVELVNSTFTTKMLHKHDMTLTGAHKSSWKEFMFEDISLAPQKIHSLHKYDSLCRDSEFKGSPFLWHRFG